MKYASLDLETTGLAPGHDQILEIGCVIDDLDFPEDTLPTPNCFHAYIAHERITGDPYALAMNAAIIKIIADGKHPDLLTLPEARGRFAKFLEKHFDNNKITFAGKNFQSFDKPFLLSSGFMLPFHHRCFDPATNFYRKGDKQLPDLKTCLERAKIELPFKLHTAVDDAKAVIALLRSIHNN